MEVKFVDPLEATMIESGYGLDAIGALKGVDLPRNDGEPDDPYRYRLIAKLRGERPATHRFEWWSPPDQFNPEGRLMYSGCCDTVNDLRGAVWAGFGEYNAGCIWVTIGRQRRIVTSCAQFDQEYWYPAHEHRIQGAIETTALSDNTKPRPNHVRDAVRANQ